MYQSPHKEHYAAELVVAFIDGTACSRIPYGSNVADICGSVQRFSQRRQKTPLFVKVHFDLLSPKIHAGVSVMLRKVLNVAPPRTGLLGRADKTRPRLDQLVFPAREAVTSHD
jgi:hypothetical protein